MDFTYFFYYDIACRKVMNVLCADLPATFKKLADPARFIMDAISKVLSCSGGARIG